MKYYIIIENNQIYSSGKDYKIEAEGFINVEVTKELHDDYVQNPKKYMWNGEKIIINPDYETEIANERKKEFEKEFFKFGNYGYYRKAPKGYQSAIESINTAYNFCKENDGLPAGALIFYQEPDFTKEEQLKEEWLVNHQILSEAMTKEQFSVFFRNFVQLWNTIEH